MEIKNWKLVELSDKILSVNDYSHDKLLEISQKQGVPLETHYPFMSRAETEFEWWPGKNFVFNINSYEAKELTDLINSALTGIEEFVYVIFVHDGIIVELEFLVFSEHVDDLIYSTLFHTIVFGKNHKYLIEVSRDYNLHSNIQIAPKLGESHNTG
jgi:hypothetical protein